MLAEGLFVVLQLTDGRVLVGQVGRVRARTFAFTPWGCGPVTIAFVDVARTSVVGPHTAHDRREAGRRQRRSGTLMGAPWPTPERVEATSIGLTSEELARGMRKVMRLAEGSALPHQWHPGRRKAT